MNQCLRCKQPCGDDAVYCNDCRSFLRNRLQLNDVAFQALPPQQAIGAVLAAARNSRTRTMAALLENDTVGSKNEYEFPPLMPTLWVSEEMDSTFPMNEDTDEDGALPDQVDPFLSRHLPSSTESIIIEEEDIRRAIEQGELISQSTSSHVSRLPWPRFNFKMVPRVPGRLRLSLFFLAILLIVASITSGTLLFLNSTHEPAHANVPKALPSLTVTPGNAHPDQIALAHISNFSPFAKIRLTHDIQEEVRTDTGAPFITLGANGGSDVRIFVDDSWGAGFHMIEAEDIMTHYTASAVLQVINDLSLRPPHLLISLPGVTTALRSTLDMGSNEQGANTLQSLVLHNKGGGWIIWSSSSDQPWLMTSPQQGIFRDGQSIFVAVTRANLKPGDYKGTITFVSNGGAPLAVQVKLTVLPLPASDAAVSSIMLVTPPVLSFTSADGGTDPTSQILTISNPGAQPLNWSLAVSALEDAFNQNFSSQYGVTWLSTNETSGTVSPNTSVKMQVNIQSRNLLPSVYSALLTFTSGRGTLNAPQVVAVTLTIQPRCGVATSVGKLSFTTISGQNTIDSQLLSLSATLGCRGPINWQGFSSASWLRITPGKSQLKAGVNSIVTVQVNAGALQPGTYSGLILFVAQQRSQTVTVQLVVLSTSPVPGSPGTPSPTAVLAASAQSFQFVMTQGQNDPAGQSLTISNTGAGSLYWQANIDSSGAPWLSVNSLGGTISSAQSMQVIVNASGAGLAAGNYSAQITLTATDNSGNQVPGSPQIVQAKLTILPACSLQVTPTSLSFTAIFLKPNPPGQKIVLKTVGTCPRTVLWTASVDTASQKWLVLSATSGTLGDKGSAINVNVKAKSLLPGSYRGQIVISAVGKTGGAIPNSPVSVLVTLTVTP